MENQEIVCRLCNRIFSSYMGLIRHVKNSHKYKSQQYYDEFLIDEITDTKHCPLCGKEKRYRGCVIGYNGIHSCCGDCNNPRTLEEYIIVFGELEGRKRYNSFLDKVKYSSSLEGILENHGKNFLEEHREKLRNANKKSQEYKKKHPETEPTKIEYWLAKGFTEEIGRKKISERQVTFNLEKCIKKYGEIEGRRRWEERQVKWQNTLKSKSQEEIDEINSKKSISLESMINKYGEQEGTEKYNTWLSFAKIPLKERLVKIYGDEGCKKIIKKMFQNRKHVNYSKVSQELFWKLYEKIKDKYKKIYFATLDGIFLKEDRSGINHEYRILYDEETLHYFMLDFFIGDINKCIEFDGEYWHSIPKQIENDTRRDALLEKIRPDIKTLRIREKDYYDDPERVIATCLDFLINL